METIASKRCSHCGGTLVTDQEHVFGEIEVTCIMCGRHDAATERELGRLDKEPLPEKLDTMGRVNRGPRFAGKRL